MKQPDDVKKRIVNEWLDKANADMVLAEHLLSGETAFLNGNRSQFVSVLLPLGWFAWPRVSRYGGPAPLGAKDL